MLSIICFLETCGRSPILRTQHLQVAKENTRKVGFYRASLLKKDSKNRQKLLKNCVLDGKTDLRDSEKRCENAAPMCLPPPFFVFS